MQDCTIDLGASEGWPRFKGFEIMNLQAQPQTPPDARDVNGNFDDGPLEALMRLHAFMEGKGKGKGKGKGPIGEGEGPEGEGEGPKGEGKGEGKGPKGKGPKGKGEGEGEGPKGEGKGPKGIIYRRWLESWRMQAYLPY
jgi:hypothetical protein